jgi:hypothetical protein
LENETDLFSPPFTVFLPVKSVGYNGSINGNSPPLIGASGIESLAMSLATVSVMLMISLFDFKLIT